MPRALMWLNLYGCEAVRHKLKIGLWNTLYIIVFCEYIQWIMCRQKLMPLFEEVLTNCPSLYPQNTIISFAIFDFWPKVLLIMTHHVRNSIIELTLTLIANSYTKSNQSTFCNICLQCFLKTNLFITYRPYDNVSTDVIIVY